MRRIEESDESKMRPSDLKRVLFGIKNQNLKIEDFRKILFDLDDETYNQLLTTEEWVDLVKFL